jgi:hypothetical protein
MREKGQSDRFSALPTAEPDADTMDDPDPHIDKNNDRTFYGTMVQTSGNGWQFASPNFSRVAL